MSGRRRSLLPLDKVRLLPGRTLPEIIHEKSTYLPESSFGEEISSNHLPRSDGFKESRYPPSSNVSSATSQKFSNMFYRTENWPSLSDTGTDSPDYIDMESSDSSASSMFSWADIEGTRSVAEEWEKIQRTLYDEDGPKVIQSHLIEECNQWKAIFPHMRVVGHSCGISNKPDNDLYDTEEEVIAIQCDSVNEINKTFLLIEEYSQKSDCQNLMPLRSNTKSLSEREKYLNSLSKSRKSDFSLVEELDSFLHITPLTNTVLGNTVFTHNLTASSIIKSEISSSRWRHRSVNSPDFVSLPHHVGLNPYKQLSLNTRDNSAASLYSSMSRRNITDTESSIARVHHQEMKVGYQNFISPSKQYQRKTDKYLNILEPIEPLSKNLITKSFIQSNDAHPRSGKARGRNISLPPILSDENKSMSKHFVNSSISSDSSVHRKVQQTLTPIYMSSKAFPKNINGYHEGTFSNENTQVPKRTVKKKKRRSSKKKTLS